MDDYQVILYIIFGIIYFIFNILKNKAKPPATLEDETPQEADAAEPPPRRRRETVSSPFDETVGRPQRRPSSFEELLQEFQDASGEANRRAEEKVKKVKEVEEDFEATYQAPDTSFSEQEVEKRMRETEMRKTLQEKASAAERAAATSNEVSRKLEETSPELEEQEQRVSERRGRKENMRRKQILAMLQNPESLRNTVVAAEILKPKHF